MSGLFYYFAASTDECAAKTVHWDGGPGGPVKYSPWGGWLGRLNRYRVRESEDEPHEPVEFFDVVEGHGWHDPWETISVLDALLTKRHGEEIFETVAETKRLVLVDRLSDRFRDTLADQPIDEIPAISRQWESNVEFDSFLGDGLEWFFSAFVGLAGNARSENRHLYIWASV